MSKINLLQLPVDILVYLFQYLGVTDLRNLVLTCRTLKKLILSENSIWRKVCKYRLIISPIKTGSTLSWYHQCRISHNWCKGIYKNKVVLQHHTHYMPWVNYLNSEYLLVTMGTELTCFSTDKKGIPICSKTVWTLDVPKVKRNDVRTNDISRFSIMNDFLVCGNRDGSTSVYVFNDIRKKPQLSQFLQDCHEDGHVEVSDVAVVSKNNISYVVTSSIYSSYIRFWPLNLNNSAYDVMKVIMYDNAGARCLAVNKTNEKLAIGLNGNSKPILLDINTFSFLTPSDSINVKQAIRDIQWHNDNVVAFVTHSGWLYLIDARTHNVVYQAMDPFQSTLYCIKSDNNHAIVVGSSEHSRCVLFDSRFDKQHVQLFFTQKRFSPVYSLDFNSSKLITAIDSGISVLNFNVNGYNILRRDYSHVFEYMPR